MPPAVDKPSMLQLHLFHDPFVQDGDVSKLETDIEAHRATLSGLHGQHISRASALDALGVALCDRHNNLSTMADLEEAVELHREAVSIYTLLQDESSSSFIRLADALVAMSRYDVTQRALLDEAIGLYRRTVSQCLVPHLALRSSIGLSRALRFLYVTASDTAALDEAIRLARKAAIATIDTFGDLRPMAVICLSDCLSTHSERFGNTGTIDEAIKALSSMLSFADPSDHPHYPALLYQYSVALGRGAIQRRDGEGLSQAIAVGRQALSLYHREYFQYGTVMHGLSINLRHRHLLLGGDNYLDEEIALHRETLSLGLPQTSDSSLAALCNIAPALMLRHRLHGDRHDLDEGIELATQSIQIIPPTYVGEQKRMNNLGTLHGARHKAFGDPADSDAGISYRRASLALCPPDHPARINHVQNLALALLTSVQKRGMLENLPEAVMLHRQGFEMAKHPSSDDYYDLGSVLVASYELRGNVQDLEEALGLLRKALELKPVEHPTRTDVFSRLASARLLRFRRCHERKDFDESMASFSDAVSDRYGFTASRLDAALEWTKAAEQEGDNPALSRAYQETVKLLPLVGSLGLDNKRRLEALKLAKRLPPIVQRAALHFLSEGKLDEAVEILEEGRATFWAQFMRLRSSHDELPLPRDAADSLHELSAKLQKPLPVSADAVVVEAQAAQRRRMTREYEELIARVRCDPGWEHFLQPLSFTSLRQAAYKGPIVILIGDETRCEAVIVRHREERPLRLVLPTSLQQLKDTLGSLDVGLMRNMEADEGCERRMTKRVIRDYEPTLARLWTNIVHPIIDSLQLKPSTGHHRTRIFWVPTGPFMFLPLHAAGIYHDDRARRDTSISDYAVSSYAPTISALLQAQKRTPRIERNAAKVLVVAQPDSPGHRTLPQTVEESLVIAQAVPPTALLPHPDGAPVSLVLSQCQCASVVHLACHGQQNRDDSLESGFLLADGCLTVSALMQLDLPRPLFAFLSACESAMGDAEQPDEVIHLAAAMMVAGFPSVIGTMWTMNDADGPAVAKEIYGELFKDDVLDPDVIPYALDDAVQKLRESGLHPRRWATYLHFGV